MEPKGVAAHTARMRETARSVHSQRIPFDSIEGKHRDILAQTIKNTIATELAIFTYAQIVDGLPTADVAWDRRYPGLHGDHIIDDMHEELCPGAMEKAREFYAE